MYNLVQCYIIMYSRLVSNFVYSPPLPLIPDFPGLDPVGILALVLCAMPGPYPNSQHGTVQLSTAAAVLSCTDMYCHRTGDKGRKGGALQTVRFAVR